MKAPGKVSIAICDRCHMKKPYMSLKADGNAPGLRVCSECWDTKDPYKLPPKPPDPMTLEYPRPDVDIAIYD
jgi:hypothetical protein